MPRLTDVRGIALDRITDFKQLDPREPAVAIIDDVNDRQRQKKRKNSSRFLVYFLFRIYVLIAVNAI